MVIEFLYNELTLYGEDQNLKYFKLLFPDAEIIETSFKDTPHFANHDVDLIFIGPMSEDWLQKIYHKLEPHKKKLEIHIENKKFLIAINSALDILGQSLEIKNPINPDETNYTLGLFDYKTIRDYNNRRTHITKFLYEGQSLVATSSGFSQYYGNDSNYFYESLDNGWGFNSTTKKGGYKYKNAYLSEQAGLPLLTNPYLLKKLSLHFNGHNNIPLESEINYMHDRLLEQIKPLS